jgi:hypothetical protein
VSKGNFSARKGLLFSEMLQFAGMLVFFVVALVLWLWIVYLPGRTLERWQDQRAQASKESRLSEESPTRARIH